MLKVVIADDEARVCRLVQMLADWDALGMEVIATASNGIEALEAVRSLMPDILITDIRMPGMSGLELIERAKQAASNLEIVLISGYAQFEYAQTAMRYDVGGYLLKPIKKDELTATLEKLGDKCRRRLAAKAVMENLRKATDKSHGLLKNRLVDDLLHKRLDAPHRELLSNEYGFTTGDGLLQVFVLKMDYEPENQRGTYINVIQKKAEEMFDAALTAMGVNHAFQFFGSAGYGIVNYGPLKSSEVRRALRQCLNQLEAQKSIFGAVEFSLALGKAVCEPEQLPVSMRDARAAIAERIIEGTGRLLDEAPPASQISPRALLDKYDRLMEHTAYTLSIDEANSAVDALADEARKIADVRGYELLDLIQAAGRLFAARLDIEAGSEALAMFVERCGLCGSADRLFDCLRIFQRQQIILTSEQRENEAIRPIRIAKQYIHEHYSQPITLADVCAATGFSTSYFSTMFKKETGEGFAKYLTRVRIERAKSLLQDTNLSVEEICGQVGYSDLKHFTGTFKKMTSLNPRQYRKLYG